MKYIRPSIFIMFAIGFYACNSSMDDDSIESHDGYDNEITKPKITIYQEKNLVISAKADRLIKDEGEDAILIGNVISDFLFLSADPFFNSFFAVLELTSTEFKTDKEITLSLSPNSKPLIPLDDLPLNILNFFDINLMHLPNRVLNIIS